MDPFRGPRCPAGQGINETRNERSEVQRYADHTLHRSRGARQRRTTATPGPGRTPGGRSDVQERSTRVSGDTAGGAPLTRPGAAAGTGSTAYRSPSTSATAATSTTELPRTAPRPLPTTLWSPPTRPPEQSDPPARVTTPNPNVGLPSSPTRRSDRMHVCYGAP